MLEDWSWMLDVAPVNDEDELKLRETQAIFLYWLELNLSQLVLTCMNSRDLTDTGMNWL